MKLEELKTRLEERNYDVELKLIDTAKTKQERLFIKGSKEFKVHFAMYEDKPFLYVFIKHPWGFDYTNYKQTDEEKLKCKKAKFKLLDELYRERIDGLELEDYDNEEAVLLAPKSSKKRIEL